MGLLQLQTEELKADVRSKLMKLKFGTKNKSSVDIVKLDLDGFSSLYGFIAAVPDDCDTTLTVIYAFHKLVFSLPKGQIDSFSPAEIDAIKNHYGKKKALMNLKVVVDYFM